MNAPPRGVVGILLAAGRGERFGGAKLLALAPWRMGAGRGDGARAGECIGVAACRNLLAAVPRVVAVVRPDDAALAAALGASGATIARCPNADAGMGASLAFGVRATAGAAGWIVALADMPWIRPATIARVVAAIADGAPVAAPFHDGRRGHPVGFSVACHDKLAALGGDEGAKAIISAYADELAHVAVDDPGTLLDIDTQQDLVSALGAMRNDAR